MSVKSEKKEVSRYAKQWQGVNSYVDEKQEALKRMVEAEKAKLDAYFTIESARLEEYRESERIKFIRFLQTLPNVSAFLHQKGFL